MSEIDDIEETFEDDCPYCECGAQHCQEELDTNLCACCGMPIC